MKRAVIVLAACGGPATPATTPHPVTTCDEAPLRALAAKLGDGAPTFELETAAPARTANVLCPADADDQACKAFGRSHVQLAADERVTGAVVTGRDTGTYDVVLEVDGARRTETFPDLTAASARVEELKAQGHDAVMISGQRMLEHDSRTAVVSIANPATPLRRKVVMHLPVTTKLGDAYRATSDVGLDLVAWNTGEAANEAIATCR